MQFPEALFNPAHCLLRESNWRYTSNDGSVNSWMTVSGSKYSGYVSSSSVPIKIFINKVMCVTCRLSARPSREGGCGSLHPASQNLPTLKGSEWLVVIPKLTTLVTFVTSILFHSLLTASGSKQSGWLVVNIVHSFWLAPPLLYVFYFSMSEPRGWMVISKQEAFHLIQPFLPQWKWQNATGNTWASHDFPKVTHTQTQKLKGLTSKEAHSSIGNLSKNCDSAIGHKSEYLVHLYHKHSHRNKYLASQANPICCEPVPLNQSESCDWSQNAIGTSSRLTYLQSNK